MKKNYALILMYCTFAVSFFVSTVAHARTNTELVKKLKRNKAASKSPLMLSVEKQKKGNGSRVHADTTASVQPREKLKEKLQERNTKNMLTQPTERLPQEFQQLEPDKSVEDAAEKASVFDAQENTVEFQFENADLHNLVTQMSDMYNITFITDDILTPLGPGGKDIHGNKITFKTNEPLSKKEAWNLFVTFLDIAGLALVPQANPNTYRITALINAKKSAIPAFIGTKYENLPDNDEMIRYVYFIQNSTVDTIKGITDSLRSPSSTLVILQELKAFMITGKAYNIKSLMKIVRELDQVSMPQSMSVLKLRRADAQEVKKLYDSLINKKDDSVTSRFFPNRKKPSSLYFPESIRIIAEPRTNALILLGPQDAIQKIENFIVKHVDVELGKAYSPLFVYQLKYADANNIAEIMTNVTKFGRNTEAGKNAGVRGEDKYLGDVTFTPEPATNRIIIRGHYQDYLKVKKIIDELDEEQPQVAIEVLILGVTVTNTKELGAQIRNKANGGQRGILGDNVNFQTSGLRAGGAAQGIQEKTTGSGASRLLGDLINLVTGATSGNTVITLGNDACGVWGVLQALQTISNTQVISNPFVVATNKTPAKVSLGEVRRVVTSTVVGTSETDSFGDEPAKTELIITPQINSDGMIVLDIQIIIDAFTSNDETNATKTTKEINTKTIVADKEVLALGGLVRNKIDDNLSKTPLLGDIPVLGWFFKNKRKSDLDDSLLILISTSILNPKSEETDRYTQERINDYQGTLAQTNISVERKDPIHRWFFKEPPLEAGSTIFKRHKKNKQTKSGKKKESKRKKKHIMESKLEISHNRRRKKRRRGRSRKQPVFEPQPLPTITPVIAQKPARPAAPKTLASQPRSSLMDFMNKNHQEVII